MHELPATSRYPLVGQVEQTVAVTHSTQGSVQTKQVPDSANMPAGHLVRHEPPNWTPTLQRMQLVEVAHVRHCGRQAEQTYFDWLTIEFVTLKYPLGHTDKH